MMAPMLSAAPANPPGRISQILPTVKCSNCNHPVPLAELGDHVCSKPLPVPTLPKPAVSPAAATSLLPQRLQGRVASPGPTKAPPTEPRLGLSPQQRSPDPPQQRPGPAPPQRLQDPLQQRPGSTPPQRQVPPPQRPQDPLQQRPGSTPPQRLQDPPQQRSGPSPNDRPRINTAAPSNTAPYQPRSSPLARPDADRSNTASPAGRAPYGPSPPNDNGSPLRNHPPPSLNVRSRAMSNAGSVASGLSGHSGGLSPVTARPSFPSTHEMVPPLNVQPVQPPPRQMPPVSYASHINESDIDTKSGGEAGMAGVGRRGFAAAARAAMFVAPMAASSGSQFPPGLRTGGPRFLNIHVPPPNPYGIPPLSPGAGNPPHSPSLPYSQSPISPQRSPTSPGHIDAPPHNAPVPEASIPAPPASPMSVRMPFFEKFKNQIPGVTNPDSNNTPTPNPNTSTINTPSTAVPPPRPQSRDSDVSSASSYSRVPPSRTLSINTTTSRDDVKEKRPLSPSSGSECGLAYADSSDYEDDGNDVKKSKANPPPPLALTSSILRSGSIASTNHVRFPSNSDRSDRSSVVHIQNSVSGHKRDASVSSVSSTSSAGGGERSGKSNSALIAHALGLSQTPPSEYSRLGGPGVTGGRSGRSGSGSSSGGRSAYSRGSGRGGLGAMEREMDTLLEGVAAMAPPEERKGGLSKSNSTGKQRSFGVESGSDSGAKSAVLSGSGGGGAKAQRSNTVQGIHSPETKPPKLPARARTSTVRTTEKARAKKERVCLKCEKKIEDGRWVQTDGAGVLCEKCWKNMYLPKCRRCTLPIEKQAVSSSDGQLKGKYHRECFNCHTCHKPFPDKTFYVFDGKPLCAYHYHEANDSLCAAARCGQPIEGPCAVSHTGDRYHPEHMTCEHPGAPCGVRLEEYWEVDGRMLCERHAHASKVGSDDEAEEEWVQSSRAMKRVTRFIDLAGGSDLR